VAINKKLDDFRSALKRVEEALSKTAENANKTEYPFFRDSTIQRFEFTLEIAWKSIKQFLLEQEGIECRSPKGCVREFFGAGYLDESQASLMLQMIDDRNLATHTYHETLAEEIYADISSYYVLLVKIHEMMRLSMDKK